MTQERPKPKGNKRGPKAGPKTVPVTVWLEPDLSEWGKKQPGGLSALLRQALHREKQKTERAQKPTQEGLPL